MNIMELGAIGELVDSIPPHDQARVRALYSNVMNLCQEGFAQRERGEMEEDLARLLDFTPAVMLQMSGMATHVGLLVSIVLRPRQAVDRLG